MLSFRTSTPLPLCYRLDSIPCKNSKILLRRTDSPNGSLQFCRSRSSAPSRRRVIPKSAGTKADAEEKSVAVEVRDGSDESGSRSRSFLSVLCPLLNLFGGGDPSQPRNEVLESSTTSMGFNSITWNTQGKELDDPSARLQLFEFEACPFCRSVREAMTGLDLSIENKFAEIKMSTVNDDIEEKTMTFILQQEPADEDEIVDEAFNYGSTYEPFRSEDDDFPEEFEMTISNLQEESSDQIIMETVSSSDGVEKNEISDYVSSLSVSEFKCYPPYLEIEEIDEWDFVFSPTSSSISSRSSFSPSQPQSRLITSKPTLTTSMVEWFKTLPKVRFFSTKPYISDPSSLPKYPPSKELDAKLQDKETRRRRTAALKGHGLESTKQSTGEPKAVQGSNTEVQIAQIPNRFQAESVSAGWPAWLASVAGEAIKGWVPRKANSFLKLEKIGEGRHSIVYKGTDLETGKFVALKKVRFVNMDPESVRFIAREIYVLRRLDHINVIKLEGLITTRMSFSLYLVLEYMEHDLAGLAATPAVKFSEPQVKCYMQQLLRGLDHCHSRGVLHRDIKGSNLLVDNNGILKLADFGLATFFSPDKKQPLTSRVVTLWYRPPELLLGATEYSTAVDLWSAGCILAELLAGKPIMPGRSEVEQLHEIFKLCGSPSEEYWRKSKLPSAVIFRPQRPYRRCVDETFKDFPPSALALLDALLAIEPANRGTAISALESEFFSTKPYTCDPSSLPKYPPSKELESKLRDEETRRQRTAALKGHGEPKAVQDSYTEVPAYNTKQRSMNFSGPLIPPGENMDEMLKEHERQIQHIRRSGFGSGNQKRNHN